ADMLEGNYDLVQRDEQLSILYHYVKSVLPDIDPGEEPFRTVAARLVELELERRASTESYALTKSLALPFELDEDWQIYISIPLCGNPEAVTASGHEALLIIETQSDWQLRVQVSDQRSY